MPALGAAGVLLAGVGARGGSEGEEDVDKIAALGRRGDVSLVYADARVCYNWAPAEWYLGTVKSGTSSKERERERESLLAPAFRPRPHRVSCST